MLEQLLETQVIELLECKWPKEMEKVDNFNYCKYRQVISHLLENCFVLKEQIIKLVEEGKVELHLDEVT